MKNFKFFVLIFSFLFSVFTFFAFAKSEKGIVFPVSELENCKNKTECKAFCDKPGNMQSCIAFAKSHNLMSEKEARRAEKVAVLSDQNGPGGCQGFEECKSFCDNSNNALTCIAFAKTHSLMDKEELEEAEKVATILRGGAKLPGDCASKEKCEQYCQDDNHTKECIEFAHKAGFIQDKEYEIAKKTGGKGPGGCKGKECERYCEDESHFTQCVAFGEEHGMISHKEAQIAKETGGKGPGGCRGKECKDYCENPDNFDKCLEFGKEHGLMSEKDYEMAKTTGGKGPGGCQGEECKKYCEDLAHKEECMNFAKEHGLMPPQNRKDAKDMEHAKETRQLRNESNSQIKKEEVKQKEEEEENDENIEEDNGLENQDGEEGDTGGEEDCPAGSNDCDASLPIPQDAPQSANWRIPQEQGIKPGEFHQFPPQSPPLPPAQPFIRTPPSARTFLFAPLKVNTQPQPFIDTLGATLIHTFQFLIGK